VPDSPIPQPTKIITPINPICSDLERIITAHLKAILNFTTTQPNAEPLWASIRSTASNYLFEGYIDEVLQGDKPEQAYFVKCGLDTMTQLDIDSGRVIVLVGFAPIAPAEFVNIRISLPAAPQ
jgi:uncharacterized protein